MDHVTSKTTESHFDLLADTGAKTGAVASLLGVEDGVAETSADTSRAESSGGLTLQEEKPFRLPSEMMAALTERYSNIAIGKIQDVSEAAVQMMLKRAGVSRANRVFSSPDDWQATIIRAELKAELARNEKAKGTSATAWINRRLPSSCRRAKRSTAQAIKSRCVSLVASLFPFLSFLSRPSLACSGRVAEPAHRNIDRS
jgi:hypothetical protein